MMLLLAAVLTVAPTEWKSVRGTVNLDPAATHQSARGVRVEAAGADALIRAGELKLTPGKRYHLEGWLRSRGLKIDAGDRTSVPTGVSLGMRSMPWDVHTSSISGTRDWTLATLDFTATRAADWPEIRVAPGSTFSGQAWVSGVSVTEINTPAAWPTKVAVRGFGPAYRFGKAGWTYLHIEGEPFERGFQHGYLMATEIESYIDRCAHEMNSKDRRQGYQQGRAIADSVFTHAFDREILTEMKGIAEGAAAAGAKYNGRAVDLVDIVFANTITEIDLLAPAAQITPTGLEGLGLTPPSYFDPKKPLGPTEHCSAFAATGKATRDGHMVMGHTTMWPLTLAEDTNVMLDIRPAAGQRMLIQSYPGGIQSGTDWYQNGAGMVLTETTIRQSPLDITGLSVGMRARKAIQYGTDVAAVAHYLEERNNGLYTNEWLIGDAKNDEIAMFELGTRTSKLWRSSKDEWFDGTEGFYWGCNNSKDLNVRLEYVPDPKGRPTHLPFMPSARDLKWKELYAAQRGTIDEGFAFDALRTPPLVSASAFDSKVTTTEMASRLTLWALLGKPNEREWVAEGYNKQYPKNEGIFSSGYTLFEALAAAPEAAPAEAAKEEPKPTLKKVEADKLWKGWLLPATPADEWITLGSASWYRILSSEKPDERLQIMLRSARESESAAKTAHAVAVFDAIRKLLGDDKFVQMLVDYYAKNTTKSVSTADFPVSVPKVELPDPKRAALLTAMFGRLKNSIIVYGTDGEAGSNRHAAEKLQREWNDWFEREVPAVADHAFDATMFKTKTVIFVGRPETNSALRAVAGTLRVKFDGATFQLDGRAYGHQRDGVVSVEPNPANPAELVLVLAGNCGAETVRVAGNDFGQKSWLVTRRGETKRSGF
jgi:hypothetical protein